MKYVKKHRVKSWTFITAYYPYSKVLSDNENMKRHLDLVFEVALYKYFEGEGIGDDKSWKPEKEDQLRQGMFTPAF